MGEIVEFASNGGSERGYLARPASGSGPGVVVIQEWWGLVPHIERVCDRFAEAGFVALAPDLYHGRVAAEPDDAAKAMMGLRLPRTAQDLSGAVDEVVARSAGTKVGVVGFCIGGGLALVLGAARPDAIGAVVPFYGFVPWDDVEVDWPALAAPVLAHFAEHDDYADAAWVAELRARLAAAGHRDVTTYTYPGTAHAFFNDDRPEVYDRAAAELAFARTVEMLHAQLG